MSGDYGEFMNFVIVTGASRGLGEGIVKELIKENALIICISRTKNNELIRLSKINDCILEYYEFDLLNLNKIPILADEIFSKNYPVSLSSISLINNAGTLTPIKPIDKAEPADIINNFNLNIIAPALLTSLFIKHTSNFDVEKRVINISSGAASKPYFGWSCYSSSKSALEAFGKCVSVEQQNNNFKIISFVPGVIDTEMQAQIRSASRADFKDLDRFLGLKNDGKLFTPEYVASKLVEILKKKDIKNGDVINIKDLCPELES